MRHRSSRVSASLLLLAVACTQDVNTSSPFGTTEPAMMTGVSASGPSSTSGTGMGSDDPGSNSTPAEDTMSEDTGPGATTTGPSTGDTTAGDPCVPNPCGPGEACVDGDCVPSNFPGPGDVVFTELMPNPAAVTDAEGEWIELTNVSAAAVDIEGCELVDDGNGPESDIIDSGAPIMLAPGQRVVLAKVADPAINGGVEGVVYDFGASFSLTNDGGDELELQCGGTTIDALVYDFMFGYGSGIAMQLDPGSQDATANDDPTNWCAATSMYGSGDLGTPGTPNGGC